MFPLQSILFSYVLYMFWNDCDMNVQGMIKTTVNVSVLKIYCSKSHIAISLPQNISTYFVHIYPIVFVIF